MIKLSEQSSTSCQKQVASGVKSPCTVGQRPQEIFYIFVFFAVDEKPDVIHMFNMILH